MRDDSKFTPGKEVCTRCKGRVFVLHGILDKFLVAGFWFLASLAIADACLAYGPWWP